MSSKEVVLELYSL